MAIEYLGLSEINGPLVVLEGVKNASYEGTHLPGRKTLSSAGSVPSDIRIRLHPYHDEEHLWKVRYLQY